MSKAGDMVQEIQQAVASPTGRLAVSPAFGSSGTYWGVQVYDGRKKVGMFMVATDEHGQTPAGALRSLADILEADAAEIVDGEGL